MKSRVIWTTLFVILLALLLVDGLALAQDLATNTPGVAFTVTDEAGNVTTGVAPVVAVAEDDGLSPEFFILAAVTLGLLAVVTLVLRPLIVQLGQTAPPWAMEAAFSAVNSFLTSMAGAAEGTSSTIDDELVKTLQEEIARLKAEVLKMRVYLPASGRQEGAGYFGTLPPEAGARRDVTQPPGMDPLTRE